MRPEPVFVILEQKVVISGFAEGNNLGNDIAL
jgi:hypothetical protein